MAINVTLRKKKIQNGKLSLYLDFYPPILNPKNGKKTRREFLKLYILEKPVGAFQKKNNKETLRIAQQICYKRENELSKPEIYSEYEKELLRIKALGERSFIKYYEGMMDKREGSNYSNWSSSLNYLKEFAGDYIKFKDVDVVFCNDYKDFLLKAKNIRHKNNQTISQNTAHSYFNKFKATLKQAFKDGILQTDINGQITSIKEEETQREFLTSKELAKLAHTECTDETLKRAALFSALTGLRFSDIKKLTWKEVTFTEDQGYYIRFTQQKTKGKETLPISEQAYGLMGEKTNPEDKVFKDLKYASYYTKIFHKWLDDAEITKEITFHNFRHTHAVLQLQAGTDLYTISKMLGHKSIKTTQIYAKIVDETLRKASNKIKIEF